MVDASCKLSHNPEQPITKTTATLGHILNNCKRMLERYEWRHNGVLAYHYKEMSESKPPGIEIYADIEGAKVNGGTLPPEVVITT